MKTTNEQLKWQIEAEMCLIQISLSIIIWKLFGGWILGILCTLSILGNINKAGRAIRYLGRNYFRQQ